VIYLDTSALIKRFVNEKGSPLVQSIVQRTEAIATAKNAYAEIFAGLTRKLREAICRKHSTPWLVANLKAIGTHIFEWSWTTISYSWPAT
jgi:predicted nucleic acid-binding protein